MEQQVDAQTTQTDQQTGMNIAGSEASQKGFDPEELLSTDFLTTFTDPRVDRSYPDDDPAQYNIQELLSAEFSPQLQLGQITRSEYETEKQMDKSRALLAMCQFADPHGVGSKCKDDSRKRMLGGHSDAEDVEEFRKGSDDLRQQIRTSYEVRSQMRSGASTAAFCGASSSRWLSPGAKGSTSTAATVDGSVSSLEGWSDEHRIIHPVHAGATTAPDEGLLAVLRPGVRRAGDGRVARRE